MKKIVRGVFLPAFALFAVSPVIFLLAGTFMGNQEIIECISPVFMDGGGYAGWRLVPQYPTLGNVVELLLDSPEFFKMFWNSAKITVFILAGQLIFGMPAAWGMARYDFRGKKMIYTFYIVMMMMPFQVTMLSEYLVLDRLHLSGNFFDIFCIYYVPFFPRHPGEYYGCRQNRRRRRTADICGGRHPTWLFRNNLRACALISGMLQHDRAADDIFKDEKPLAAVTVSA